MTYLLLITLLAGVGGVARSADNGVPEPGIDVINAETEVRDDVLFLNAHFRVRLQENMVAALHGGIPIVILIRIEVSALRHYLWDDEILQLEQRYQLSYRALTGQYGLKNLNSGSENVFPSLRIATDVLGTVIDLPVMDRGILDKEREYIGNLRVSVDRSFLPLPLRLQSYIYTDWDLSSEWYSWPIQF